MHAFDSVARWSELSFLRHSKHYRELKSLAHVSLEPERLQRMFDIVEGNKGLALYDAVAKVKQLLSTEKSALLQFRGIGHDAGIEITRASFEQWIADDLERISVALAATFENSNVSSEAIDAVFMTGGTSLVPAVRRVFSDKFGEDRLHGGDELISVAKGLVEVDGWGG